MAAVVVPSVVDLSVVVNGTDVAIFDAGIACRLTGNRPLALNPALMCSGLKEASHSFFIKPVCKKIVTQYHYVLLPTCKGTPPL